MNFTSKEISISFCTTCRNRLEHLKLTLPENIKGNIDYPQVKFIILDYTSNDGLAEWVKENFNDHLECGKLEFYRYEEATFFHRTHSRNLVFKIASTDVVCNVDADNYIGKGFVRFISEQFALSPDIFLTTIDFYKTQKSYNVSSDVFGRLCVKKTHFLAVGGFDERMEGYGFEDYDLANRLEMLGLERRLIEHEQYLHYISHGNNLRHKEMIYKNIENKIYILHELPWKSSIIYLFENSICAQVTLINNARINADHIAYAFTERKFLFKNSFEAGSWYYGNWEEKENLLYLTFDNKKKILQISTGGFLYDTADIRYYQVNNSILFESLTHLFRGSKNRMILEENLRNKEITVNNGLFGRGSVSKNFQNLIIVE